MNDKDFLDKDHQVSLDAIVQAINSEIQWCHVNPVPERVDGYFCIGFIKGLEQAKFLIIEAAKVLVEDEEEIEDE